MMNIRNFTIALILNLSGYQLSGMQTISSSSQPAAAEKAITIRMASSTDVPAVVNLKKQWQKNNANFNPANEHGLYALMLTLGNILVVEDEQKNVVGMLIMLPCPILDGEVFTHFKSFLEAEVTHIDFNWLEKHRDVQARYIHELYVDESCRGKGIGKKLLQQLTQQFPLVQKIYLITSLENHRAVGFYNHLGFIELMRTQKVQNDDAILFSLDTTTNSVTLS